MKIINTWADLSPAQQRAMLHVASQCNRFTDVYLIMEPGVRVSVTDRPSRERPVDESFMVNFLDMDRTNVVSCGMWVRHTRNGRALFVIEHFASGHFEFRLSDWGKDLAAKAVGE